jgi:sugar phosphate isomerase/epimerase
MRLGGPVYLQQMNPDDWINALKKNGYRAAYCPVQSGAGSEEVRAYAAAARQADIVIAEVGAWVNTLDLDEAKRRDAIAYNQRQLALAEEIGALCCVNIAGSRGEKWDGPSPEDLTPETFAMIVDTVREIIDAVKPQRAFYTLEPMPWMYPDSPDSYLALIDAIDRPRFGVHFDPVNWMCSPQRYFHNASFLRECFEKLGSRIVSVHAKDTLLGTKLTTHLDEVRPGLGKLDYRTFLQEMDRLPVDTPLMLEHLEKEEEYRLSADYIREVAAEIKVTL